MHVISSVGFSWLFCPYFVFLGKAVCVVVVVVVVVVVAAVVFVPTPGSKFIFYCLYCL